MSAPHSIVPPAVLRRLIRTARECAENAYAPYSRFKVGAAVLSTEGRITGGCNVENASYGLTVCAERNAVFRAVADGAKQVAVVLVYGGAVHPAPPCGACRQVMAEFGADATVISLSRAGNRSVWRMSELLPAAFNPKELPSPPRRIRAQSGEAERPRRKVPRRTG